MTQLPVYFMPGLAASPQIFERIRLDPSKFEVVFLEWKTPLKNEGLVDYCKRIIKDDIKHENPVLIGVSFGGVVVQEIARIINVRKVIIISSIKSHREFPKRMTITQQFKLYHLFPTRLVGHVDTICKLPFSGKVKERIKLYQMYLSVNDKRYLDWAFKEILEWKCDKPLEGLIHIQGDRDGVFPVENIPTGSYIKVPGGTHVMILNKYKWFNQNLPDLIG